MGNEFKDRLSELIYREKLNSSSFADALGIARQNVSQYLKGTNPNMDFFNKLRTNFKNVNLNWLIWGEGSIYIDMSEEISMVAESNINYKPQKNDDIMVEQLVTLRKMVDYLLQENTTLKNELNEHRKGQNKAAI